MVGLTPSPSRSNGMIIASLGGTAISVVAITPGREFMKYPG